jgi:glyoxylase-like metal-dependent hydrolase (beta-lactamase superfamily II)
MKIHHLNCGSLYARIPRTKSIVYCLLVETNEGLILVDSGMGRKDYTDPSLLMRGFIYLLGIPCKMEETAVHQVEDLGYRISDVRHIVLTHLHLDHAGGLSDFPSAKVHIYQTEYEAGMNPRTLLERGYDPSHWSHGPNWVVHGGVEVDWYGFRSLPIIKGLEPEIRLVPLPGHTRGHCGVAVATEKGWLLQCGDAASPQHPASDLHGLDSSKHTTGILPEWFVLRFLGPHAPRIRELLREHEGEIEAISGHDIYSFERYTSRAG